VPTEQPTRIARRRTNQDGRLPRLHTSDLLDSGLPELQRLATTVETWWPQILAFTHTGITNAGSEGTNRVIKTIARDAYGFRNPESQRLRTRCGTTRRARRCLNPPNFDEPVSVGRG
jgi:transposase